MYNYKILCYIFFLIIADKKKVTLNIILRSNFNVTTVHCDELKTEIRPSNHKRTKASKKKKMTKEQ